MVYIKGVYKQSHQLLSNDFIRKKYYGKWKSIPIITLHGGTFKTTVKLNIIKF